MSELTYAKVNGPPNDWQDLYVVNKDTGQLVPEVREVNTKEGWIVKFAEPLVPCSGSPQCPECEVSEPGQHARLEKVAGNYEIRRRNA